MTTKPMPPALSPLARRRDADQAVDARALTQGNTNEPEEDFDNDAPDRPAELRSSVADEEEDQKREEAGDDDDDDAEIAAQPSKRPKLSPQAAHPLPQARSVKDMGTKKKPTRKRREGRKRKSKAPAQGASKQSSAKTAAPRCRRRRVERHRGRSSTSG